MPRFGTALPSATGPPVVARPRHACPTRRHKVSSAKGRAPTPNSASGERRKEPSPVPRYGGGSKKHGNPNTMQKTTLSMNALNVLLLNILLRCCKWWVVGSVGGVLYVLLYFCCCSTAAHAWCMPVGGWVGGYLPLFFSPLTGGVAAVWVMAVYHIITVRSYFLPVYRSR